MSDFSRIDPIKSTRKSHHCFLCCKTIPAGSKMFNWSGVYENTFFHSKICETCEQLLHLIENEDGYSEGDMNEYAMSYGVDSPGALLMKFQGEGKA